MHSITCFTNVFLKEKKGRFQGIPNGFLPRIGGPLSLYCLFATAKWSPLSHLQPAGKMEHRDSGSHFYATWQRAESNELATTGHRWLVKPFVECKSTAENIFDPGAKLFYSLTIYILGCSVGKIPIFRPALKTNTRVNIQRCCWYRRAYKYFKDDIGKSLNHAKVNLLCGYEVKHHVHWLW